MQEAVENFLSDILSEGTKFEFTAIKDHFVNVISKEEAMSIKTKNIYVLGGLDKNFIHRNGKRAKDIDILNKCYFALDIDLRNNYKELGEEITNEDIIQEGLNLVKELKGIEFFNDWSYMIYTGNGLHLYFIGDDIKINHVDYSLAVKRIFKKFDTLFGEQYRCDHACCNIARILRLPGSVNQKNMIETKIIAKQDNQKSKLVNQLFSLAEKEKEEQRIKQLKSQRKIQETLSEYKDGGNEVYEMINKNIPAYVIAELIIPQFPFNGRKNFKNKKGGFTAYYYDEEHNIIMNGGSRYFSEKKGYNNFELIKSSKNFTNAEVFDFYKELLKLNQK